MVGALRDEQPQDHAVRTVTTVNVNGLRAAARKGFMEWLAGTEADVVCLQETRARPEQLPAGVGAPDGWHAVHAPGEVAGRCGVAVYSRAEPESVREGFGAAEFEGSGRYLEVELPGLTVASLYLPSGDVGTPRQDEKYRFMEAFAEYLGELAGKSAAAGREVLVCGDWNIAHRPVDLRNWKNNQCNAGFLPEERAWLDTVFGELGYADVVRGLHPDEAGPYSWWSYRGQAFDRDTGWRIDLVVGTQGIAASAVSAIVERAESYDKRWSDHAPVTV
ncbi:MAG: exodeoxyribonuclease III, partial [Sciscionella sp.]